MSIEEIDDRGMASWADHDAQAFADLFAERFVLRDVAVPDPITSRDDVLAYARTWFTAFPDKSVKQTNRVVGEDSVAAEVEFTGTNTGPMMMAGKEIPPTGKSVVGTGCYFARVRDDKVVEFSAHPEIAGMMMQLGFIPEM
jgi:predicted ester cyclase